LELKNESRVTIKMLARMTLDIQEGMEPSQNDLLALAPHDLSALHLAAWLESPQAMLVLDPSGRVRAGNPALCNLLGYAHAELHLLREHELLSRFAKSSLLDEQTHHSHLLTKHGDDMPVRVRRQGLPGSEDRLQLLFVSAEPAGVMREALGDESPLTHDALTGLLNRTEFTRRANDSCRRAKAAGEVRVMLFLDLDGFKGINDTLGHPVGDKILALVAARMRRVMGESGFCCRIGGDEFACLVETADLCENWPTLAERLVEDLGRIYNVDQRALRLRVSVGVSLYPDDGETADELVRCADMAMYRAKAGGGNRAYRFQAGLKEQVRHKVSMEQTIHRALDQGQFVLHYLPTIDLRTGHVSSVETLLRLEEPGRPAVLPPELIGVAESSGLIVDLGEWVIRAVCAQIAQVRQAVHPRVVVSTNVSALQLTAGDYHTVLQEAITQASAPSGSLALELTEQALMRGMDWVPELVQCMQLHNVQLWMDDFGAGNASFSLLTKLPFTELKLDRSLARSLSAGPVRAALAKAVVSVAKAAKMRVVAEGIEDEQQVHELRALGCQAGQGYLFARPMPLTQLAGWYQSWTELCSGPQNPTARMPSATPASAKSR
jgi:diguanylate cyclase (GGDEF)-like protein